MMFLKVIQAVLSPLPIILVLIWDVNLDVSAQLELEQLSNLILGKLAHGFCLQQLDAHLIR